MLKQRFMKHSLYTTLGIIIFATVMLVMSAQLIYNYNQISNRLTAELKTDAHQTATALKQNISPFIQSYSVAEYQSLIKNEIQHKRLLAIIVSDKNMAAITGSQQYLTGYIQTQPDQYSEYNSESSAHQSILKASYFSDTHDVISASGNLVGSVTIYASDQKIVQAIDDLFFSSLVNFAFITTILTLLLFIAIKHFLLNPIYQTVSLIKKTDETGIPTQEIEITGPEEISQLGQTINTMLHTIRLSRTALAESEFRWKFAVDGRGDGLWDWQIETGAVYYSPQWKQLLKCSDDTLVNDVGDFKVRLHPADYQTVWERMQQVLDGKTAVFDSEHRLCRDDGQIIWVHDRGIVVEYDDHNNPLRMIGTITDISERIAAQEELKRAHSINKLIIETIPDLLWLKDTEGRYLLCNSKFEQFFGAKEDDIINKTDYDFVDQELADFFRKHDRHAMEAGEPVTNQEHLTFASDGYKGLFEATKVPLVSDEREVIGILGISHDITESDNLIHQLSETKQLLLSLVNAIPFFIYRIDLKGHFTFVNNAFSAYLNQPAEALVGKCFYHALPPNWCHNCEAVDQQIIHTQTPFHEVKSVSNEGSHSGHPDKQYFEMIKLPIFDFNQHVIGIQGIFWDVTENILSKQALEHSAKHDSLTGLPNRYLFNELIQNAMHRCDRNNHFMALLYLDLDGFKEVNDCLGHEAGDEVLKNVAHPLKAALLRKEDIVARLGGDEFVIAIADLKNNKELIPILKRLLSDLHQTIPYQHDDKTISLEVTASIGVSLYPQPTPINLDELLRQADKAMYFAKNAGKNRYCFYDEIHKEDPNS